MSRAENYSCVKGVLVAHLGRHNMIANDVMHSLRWHYPDQVQGPPHTTVVLSARLNQAPLANDKK